MKLAKYLLPHTLTVAALLICCNPLLAELAITTNALARLQDDPDHEIVAAIGVKRGEERATVEELKVKNSESFPEFGIIFVKAKANEILNWPNSERVDFVDVLDDTEAAIVYHLLAQLHRIEFFDDLGVYRPGVVNLSLGPPRSLIGKDASGERAVQRALGDLMGRHGIPVVMSIGNEGPEPGLTNGWAAPGALLATAMNAAGTELWPRASRFMAPSPDGLTMFAAQGIDTIGPRANCSPKSGEELDAEERVHLAELMGSDKVACFEVATGTSFAAAFLSRYVCSIHQALEILALKLSSLTPVNAAVEIPPFVRAYVDNGFDRTHPVFSNRLADARKHFGPLRITLSASEKQDAWDSLVTTGVDIPISYNPRSVRQLLSRAAIPVAGFSREQIGEGFLSPSGIRKMLVALRYSDLVELMGENDPRHDSWVNRVKGTENHLAFTADEVSDLTQYCEKFDLVLGLPLFSQPR
jgi:hypothetical protein